MTYNSAYTGPQIDSAARLASIIFDGLPAMLADARDYTAHTAGNVFWTATEGFRYEVAASGATDHHLITAGGVKLYVLPCDDGSFNVRAFNTAADGTTDDYAKFRAAIDAAYAQAGDQVPTVRVPAGHYKLNSTIHNNGHLKLIGEGASAGASRLTFAADVTGFINHLVWSNEAGNTSDSNVWVGATGQLLLQGLYINAQGYGTNVADGLWMRAACVVRDCEFYGFGRHGVNVYAWVPGEAPGAPEMWGNANNFRLDQVKCTFNGRNGINVQGSDVNGGMGTAIDTTLNGRWGIYDSSFLGNTWIGCHAATNGGANCGNNASAGTSAQVGYLGNRFFAHPNATEQQLVDTTPDTVSNQNIWTFIGAGGAFENYATWVAAQPLGTYHVGGHYRTLQNVTESVFLGCYQEDDGPSAYAGGTVVMGGLQSWVLGGGRLRGASGGVEARGNATLSVQGSINSAALGAQSAVPEAFFGHGHISSGREWRWKQNAQGDIWLDAFNGPRYFTMSGDGGTTIQMGTGAAVPYTFTVPTLGVGSGSDIRRMTRGTAAPTTGAWARGDIIWNRDPAAAGWAGWICVTAGTPGTWKRFGAIEA